MSCEEFRRLLDNYESLNETEKLMLTAHTLECDECRKELDFLLSIIAAANTLPEIKVPDNFIENLNARIDFEELKERRLQRNIRRSFVAAWKRYGTIAACLLIAVVVGVNGKSLVSKMIDFDNGVIIEERVSSDGSDTESEGSALVQETPEAAASVSPVPASASVKSETSLSGEETKTGTKKKSQTAPRSTASPRREAARVPVQTSRPIRRNNYTPVPASAVPTDGVRREVPEEAVYEASGFELAPTPEVRTGTSSPEPYTLARENYRIPIDSVPYGDKGLETASSEVEETVNTVEGYSLAGRSKKAELAIGMYTPIDKDGNPTDVAITEEDVADVPVGSSILVSSEDEDKVKTLMDRYITGNYGQYYMTTEDKLNEMFSEMDKAGINYEKFISNSSEKVSFKLVVIS